MKPIKLVIKGLNSFIEEQTIDFEKLTEQGLFGIFGPTGSGKSTILDGITLALYGDIARKSSNYINTNCNDLNVDYKFQISGTVNRIYDVTRHFKRDKNTGSAKTHSATVVEYGPDGPKVLAEGANQVTKTCRQILGLSLEDFTRTVVLPQGKFSEFLKLEGKNRREMLERLFNLQEYGEELTRKLSREMVKTREHNNQLIGELKGYEEISEEKLEEGKKQLEESSKVLEQLKEKQKKAEADFKEKEEIWNLQKEIQGYMIRQKQLKSEKDQMEQLELTVTKGESALRVFPSLSACEKTRKSINEETQQAKQLQQKAETLSKSKEELDQKFNRLRQEREEKLPGLRENITKTESVMEDALQAVETESTIEVFYEKLQSLQSQIKTFTDQELQLEKQIQESINKLEVLQQEESGLKVSEEIRLTVQQGLMAQQQYELEKNSLIQSEKKSQLLKKEKENLAEEIKALTESLQEVIKKADAKKSEQEDLKQPPVTQQQLMKKQEEATLLKEKRNQLENLEKEIAAGEKQNEKWEQEEKAFQKQYEIKQKETHKLKTAFEDARLKNLASTLRAHLHTGDTCPVCGGMVHLTELKSEENNEEVMQLEVRLKESEAESDALSQKLNKVQLQHTAGIENCEKLKKEKEPLSQLFAKSSIEKAEEELSDLTSKLKAYEERKKLLDEEVSKLTEEKSAREKAVSEKQAFLKEKENQGKLLTGEMDRQHQAAETSQKRIDELKEKLQGKDFTAISREIQEKDQRREQISEQIKGFTRQKDEKTQEKEVLRNRISKFKGSFQRGLAQLDEQQKNKMNCLKRMGERLQAVIKSQVVNEEAFTANCSEITAVIKENRILYQQLTGENVYLSLFENASVNNEEKSNPDSDILLENSLKQYPLIGKDLKWLQEAMDRLMTCMANILEETEKSFNETQKAAEDITRQYEEAARLLLEGKTRLETLKKRMKDEEQRLSEGLDEEKLTIEEVKTYIKSREELSQLKEKISRYKEECARLSGVLGEAAGKLNGRKIEEQQWLKVQENLGHAQKETADQNEKCINLSTSVKSMEKALEKLGQLREEKQKLDHKMAILTDLDKLFKGKRFVEYVAAARLKYISIEASKKLQEITCGNYGLEVDENGRFIIRDYKNGGARRDASTLSGGETFLASLALALALSSEIQLKGTAPLELFFLDEGFGTLDDELLDVVMNSLERIHHDKLKIGIISHVEAIKNRIPVKLVLTPAQAGMGGTKVKLERS